LATNSPVTAKQVALAELTHNLSGVVNALRDRGLAETHIEGIFAEELTAHCPLCGLLSSGRELFQIGAKTPLGDNKKQVRVSRGQCGQKNCVATHYEIRFPESSPTPWAELWQIAEETTETTLNERRLADEQSARLDRPSRPLRLAIAIMLAVTAAALVYWRVRTPNWSSAPSPYRIDPTSVTPSAADL
jgi:hypothetical protein